MQQKLDILARDIRACTLCAKDLPEGPRPVFRAAESARILVAGQAPGIRVHRSGIPFDDPSGKRLRDWMGVSDDIFYDESKIAIVPMGFCYPGTGKSGDLPPRPECAVTWRSKVLNELSSIKLTLVIGQYALKWHLGGRQQKTLTDTVRNWRHYWVDGLMPLPHPSPRNNIWLKKNPWFETDILPTLRARIADLLSD